VENHYKYIMKNL